jgi:hypothetical protein
MIYVGYRAEMGDLVTYLKCLVDLRLCKTIQMISIAMHSCFYLCDRQSN